MKILITGATSKLGLKLIDALLNDGQDIYALVHKEKINKPIKQIQADILDANGLENFFSGIDLVIHLVALTHSHNQKNYFKVNVEGTKNVVLACKKNRVNRLIFVSTRAIGKEAGAYGYSKYLAEEEIKKSNINWTIIRPSEIYGLKGKEGIDKLIASCQKGGFIPIPGNGKYLLNPVYYQDIVDFLIKIVLYPKIDKKIYTLTGPKDYQYKELVILLSKFFKSKVFIFKIPLFILKFFAYLKLFIFKDQISRLLISKSSNISEAVKDYDYQPMNIIKIYSNRK
ncbi:MAG: NAD-dependent epimerase/dehydratase family protein [Candidatus Falkowbacteria bacterium]